jgi:hypothetical protein
MKLLFSSLLLGLASATTSDSNNRGLQAFSDATDLFLRWDMTEPRIEYDDSTDIFTFTFMTASTLNYDQGLEETFWNPDCMPVSTATSPGVPVSTPYIFDPTTPTIEPSLTMTATLLDDGTTEDRPAMEFKISPSEFATGALTGTYTNGGGTASINFCIRSSLGYTLSPGPASATNYQEVNFIETLVRIDYDMSAGFEVEAFSVAPKVRELTTISESYDDALEAYLCIGPQHPEYDSGVHLESKTLSDGTVDLRPYPLTDYNVDGGTKKFNQGALVNVCVKVKDEFIVQGILLDGLTSFSWLRTGGTTYDQDVGGGGDEDATITQNAIVSSAPAGNFLTSYSLTACQTVTNCDFASVLFAQFYNTDGSVSGAGDANLKFARRRRLGESNNNEGRQLQDDPGSAGMDISIDVNGEVEGPGDLKTAAGASLTTAFASAVAFVGAALLA